MRWVISWGLFIGRWMTSQETWFPSMSGGAVVVISMGVTEYSHRIWKWAPMTMDIYISRTAPPSLGRGKIGNCTKLVSLKVNPKKVDVLTFQV